MRYTHYIIAFTGSRAAIISGINALISEAMTFTVRSLIIPGTEAAAFVSLHEIEFRWPGSSEN